MLKRNIWQGLEPAPTERLLVNEDEAITTAVGYVSVLPGEYTSRGFHEDEEEVYVILKGEATLVLGEETDTVKAGDTVYVPPKTLHQMHCTSDIPLEYLYFANWPESLRNK